MTIIELEQAIRNLIAREPMVLSGNMGEVVRGVLGVTEAYRNFAFRIQSYPVQDVFKFSLLSELPKIENDVAGLACAMLQERGVNLMLYASQQPIPPYTNQYTQTGFVSQVGQMAYNPMAGGMNYQNPPMTGMPTAPVMPQSEQYSRQVYSNGPQASNGGRAKQKASPIFAGYEPTGKPSFAQSANQGGQTFKEVETNDSKKIEINKNPEPVSKSVQDETKTSKPSPAEILMGETADETTGGKATGRDYLLELLKK